MALTVSQLNFVKTVTFLLRKLPFMRVIALLRSYVADIQIDKDGQIFTAEFIQ